MYIQQSEFAEAEAYCRSIRSVEPLSRDQESRLAALAKDGDAAARHRLIEANLLFVVRIAREYLDRGLSLMELVSEGNMGLMKAVDRFEASRGHKLISYAVWWIRQAMTEALARAGRLAPQPYNQRVDSRALARQSRRLSQQLGRHPSYDELAEHLPFSRQRLRNALEVSQSERSLEAPAAPGSELRVGDILVSEDAIADRLEGAELSRRLNACMDCLTPRERQVLRYYFGLDGQPPITLEHIGSRLGLTRERIRQVRDQGLKKLRRQGGRSLRECL